MCLIFSLWERGSWGNTEASSRIYSQLTVVNGQGNLGRSLPGSRKPIMELTIKALSKEKLGVPHAARWGVGWCPCYPQDEHFLNNSTMISEAIFEKQDSSPAPNSRAFLIFCQQQKNSACKSKLHLWILKLPPWEIFIFFFEVFRQPLLKL